jgi:hypothetical protein
MGGEQTIRHTNNTPTPTRLSARPLKAPLTMNHVKEIMSIIGGAIVDDDAMKKATSKYPKAEVLFVKDLRDQIRGAMWDMIEKSSREWSSNDLEIALEEIRLNQFREYDYSTISPVLGFIGWMCWHEGYSKT